MRALPRSDRPKAQEYLDDLARRASSKPPTDESFQALVRLARITTRPRVLIVIEEGA